MPLGGLEKGFMALRKKNIIFDLGGILLNIHPERTFAAFAALGVEESMLTETHSLANKVMLAFEKGEISPDELVDYIAGLLPLEVRDMPHDALRAHIFDAWCALIGELPLYKWQRLEQLRERGYNIFLLSNTNAIHWAAISRNISALDGRDVEGYFDGIYLSYEMHLCKPDEEIFRRVLADAGLQASETMFIDDSPANCEAAERVGIEPLLVERNSAWGGVLMNDL